MERPLIMLVKNQYNGKLINYKVYICLNLGHKEINMEANFSLPSVGSSNRDNFEKLPV